MIANDSPAHLKSQLGGTVIELGFADEAVATRALPEASAATGDEGHVELEERKVDHDADVGAAADGRAPPTRHGRTRAREPHRP